MKKLVKYTLFSVAMGTFSATAQDQDLTAKIAALGARPCEDSAFLCLTLDVPRDHFANDPRETLPISFVVSPATEPSEGIVFYAIGGPGGSGLASAESYLSAFDEAVQTRLDFVFFDQRGVGPVHGLSCPLAQGIFDRSEATITDEPALLASIQSYVTDCQSELSRPDILPFVGTDQAIRDLEVFRQAIGAPKVWLYGESYGTQFMQSYATAFPDSVQGVILDGVVDLNLSPTGFYSAYILASERILSRLFAACDDIRSCADDMGAPTAAVYDRAITGLQTQAATVNFPLNDGTFAPRDLTAGMVETNAFFALYGPDGRAAFLRALSAMAQGNSVPMLRQAYGNLYIEPQTEDGYTDPGWFGAAYFAITCNDYADGAATPAVDAARILQEARALAPQAPRLLRSFYVERLVCAYWPTSGTAGRPEPFAGGDYPTLILNSDTDPITSMEMAYSVLNNLRNGYAVVMQGGPHVIWGRGLSCPDVTVSRLMFEGIRPDSQIQLCRQDFVSPYIPLTRTNDATPIDAFALAQSVEAELDASADFVDWSYTDVLEFSCDYGGRIKAMPTDMGAALQFTGCAMWPDVTLYGEGEISFLSDDLETFALDLDVLGAAKGHFNYTSDRGAGTAWITGNLDGREITMPRPSPSAPDSIKSTR